MSVGLKLILVSGQSARSWCRPTVVINPVVADRHFPPGPWLPLDCYHSSCRALRPLGGYQILLLGDRKIIYGFRAVTVVISVLNNLGFIFKLTNFLLRVFKSCY